MLSNITQRRRQVSVGNLVLTRFEGSNLIRTYSTEDNGLTQLSPAEIKAAVDEVSSPLPGAREEEV